MANGTLYKEYTKSEVDTLVGKLNTGLTSASPSAVSVANNTLKNIASISVKAGINIIVASASFPSNATGYRQIGVATSTTSSNWGVISIKRGRAVSGVATVISLCFLYNASSATTLYLNVQQNSGSELSVIGRMQSYNLKS